MLEPAREAPYRLRVVRCVADGLRQQADGADRGLQLVGDVGDEVAPGLVHALLLRAVLAQEQDEAARQRSRAQAEERAGVGASLLQRDLLLDWTVRVTGDAGELSALWVRETSGAHQPVGVGRRARFDHHEVGVEQDGAHPQGREHSPDVGCRGACVPLLQALHPGATQRYAGDETDAREKLQYDFYYLGHQSIRFDLLILGRTIRTILMGDGR